eukprot:TRINITY_DN104427_c0_g1_i1.p1 TRINITY_DN104427_c0_g1~~TRINITY_DN104427_c0_g1_i1.p1  ORF type:complete len:620 (-),score=67.12 TRINITY_DN104427_c0_g1_i1:188-2047(-)
MADRRRDDSQDRVADKRSRDDSVDLGRQTRGRDDFRETGRDRRDLEDDRDQARDGSGRSVHREQNRDRRDQDRDARERSDYRERDRNDRDDNRDRGASRRDYDDYREPERDNHRDRSRDVRDRDGDRDQRIPSRRDRGDSRDRGREARDRGGRDFRDRGDRGDSRDRGREFRDRGGRDRRDYVEPRDEYGRDDSYRARGRRDDDDGNRRRERDGDDRDRDGGRGRRGDGDRDARSRSRGDRRGGRDNDRDSGKKDEAPPPPPGDGPPLPPSDIPPQPAAEQPAQRVRKSKWGEQPPEGEVSGVPDWLRDQFVAPPIEPPVQEGQRRVKIPQHLVSRVLGRMGTKINEIQAKSNTSIRMHPMNQGMAGYSYAMVTSMTRSETDLDKAVQLINEALHQASTGGPRTTGTGIPVGEGVEKIEFKVASAIVGHLIGKGGSTIQAIQKQAGCQVGIDQASADAPESVVSIGPGSLEQCQLAERLVMEKVAEKSVAMAAQAASPAARVGLPGIGMLTATTNPDFLLKLGPATSKAPPVTLGGSSGGPKVVMPTRFVEGGGYPFASELGKASAAGTGPGGPLPVGRVVSPTFPAKLVGPPVPPLSNFNAPMSGSFPTGNPMAGSLL